MSSPWPRILLLALAVLAAPPAPAGELGETARRALESGGVEAAEPQFAAGVAAHPGDNEARLALGILRFDLAVQHFGQRQYRYGVRTPREKLPFLRLPVPENPSPETVTYEQQRDNWQGLVDDLAKVEEALAPMTADETAIVVDLDKVQMNFGGASQTLGEIVDSLRGSAPVAGPFEVRFDYADALWLRGYSHFMSAAIEFVMAYDWRADFERAGSLLYPRISPPPFPPGAEAPDLSGMNFLDHNVADFALLIHEWRWPLVDKARLASAHAHLKQMVALSRASWRAILAETDDDREWIPGPQQKHPAIPGMAVTQAQVDAWLGFLDEIDAVLDGRKLLPHWRFKQGFNFKRMLLEPREFDLISWIAGPAVVPYLESGPTTTIEDWQKWNRAFHDNFLGYAFYFN